ncbi:MAG: M23 family metallopeptidase [Rhodospirillaceae bacterium]|nr:M23 family metallopeptidase [Rhodospirillaceae bacterium]MBT6511057.1 M23 family metallopeptidase [Rhodospirillaceae bacterium]MBT7649147.1 M23 family metallopeptidase [Rhodospirillaceae bacterium]
MVRRFAVFTLAGAVTAVAATLTIASMGGPGIAWAQDGDSAADATSLGGSDDGSLAFSMPAARPMTSSTLGLFDNIETGGGWITGSALSMETFQVSQGDTLIDLLVSAGSSENDADGAIDALEQIYDPRRLQIGQVVTAVFRALDDDTGELAAVTIALDEADYVVASRTQDGDYFAERIDEPLSDALLAPVPAATTSVSGNSLTTQDFEVRRGDTLIRLAVRAGATRAEAGLAIEALTLLVDATALQIGQQLQVTFRGSGTQADLAALSLQTGDEQYVIAERQASGSFDAYRNDRPFSEATIIAPAGDLDLAAAIETLRQSGAQVDRMTIAQGDTLMDLIVQAGATITEAHEAARIMARHFDPRRLQIGQRVFLIQTAGPAGSGLTVLGMVVLDAGDDGLVAVTRLPDEGGFEGTRITDIQQIVLVTPTETPKPEIVDNSAERSDDEAEIPELVDVTDFGRGLRVALLEMQSGDTLMSLLLDAGAARVDADQAIRALRPHYDLGRMQIGQEIRAAFEDHNGDGELLIAVSIEIKDNLFVQADRQGDTFIAGRTSTPVNPAYATAFRSIPPVADIDELIRPVDEGEAAEITTEAEPEAEIELAAVKPDAEIEEAPAPVSEIEGLLELSPQAEQAWFTVQEGDSIASLLRILTPNGHEIGLVVDALAQQVDLVNLEPGNEMVVISDGGNTARQIIALSLDHPDGGTIAVVLQRDGGYGVRRASSHIDLADFTLVPASTELAESEVWPEQETGLTIETFEIAAGGTLMKGLLDLGIDTVEADRAIDSLREVFDPRSIRAGQIVEVTIDGDGLQNITMTPRAGERVEVARDSEGFQSRLVELALELELKAAVGHIESSLYQAALDGGVPPAVLADLIRAYSFDVDFQREIQQGDSFQVLYEEFVDEDGNTVRYGPPLYATLNVSGVTLPIYRFTPSSGFIDYFNDNGESVRKALIRTPIDGAQITSNFGMRTLSGYTRMHKGLDFGAPSGTPIVAAGDGVIEQLGWFGGYGNYIRIRHSSTYKTAYAHMSSYASGLADGSRVRQGQTIGYVGSTGNSTGPHLHYEVMVNDEQINPLDVRLPSGEILEGDELNQFYVERDALDGLFAMQLDEQLVASGN